MEHIDWTSLFEIEAKLVTSAHPDSSQLLLARLEKQQNSRQSSPRASLSESDDVCTIPRDQLEHQVNTYKSAIPGITSSPVSQKDLSFWSAAIVSFNDCATRIPHYSCDMVRGGVPPALRGDIWKSMAYTSGGDCGSSEDIASLKYLYDSLANEWTPYVKIIGRDLHRTFPEIDLFREQEGRGQIMMGKVLRAYSAYDMQVGYCQGLTFLVGPLLLHMDDCDAFCVLVKLLENYDLRSMFAADMAGLHLKMFQFESLLELQLPEIHAHLKSLNINTIYASQWFMSLFAVTCPLPMLVRIYDLMFLEGVTETLMRTAMAILKRNKYNILNMTEEEDVLQHLLGRRLWDVYGGDGDLLASDITSACLGSPDILSQLEQEYEAMLEERRRAKDLAKEVKDVAALPKSKSPKRFFSQGWSLSSLRVPSDRSASVSTNSDRSTRSVSGSGASMVSVDTEIMSQVDYASSVSSFDMSPTAGKTEAAVAALELELQQLRKELEQEKQERKKDREVVGAYIKGSSTTDGSLDVLKTQFGDASSSALSYEDLMMQLAESKTNEALAKQQIEDLRDELSQMELSKDTLTVPKPAAKHSRKESGSWLKW
ncbi:Rab GTPase-activating protein 1-like protein [Yarrowia sp. C11]|nr:Rab GTPase-activating protein 1-like protein [Yarrowia sp. C11]